MGFENNEKKHEERLRYFCWKASRLIGNVTRNGWKHEKRSHCRFRVHFSGAMRCPYIFLLAFVSFAISSAFVECCEKLAAGRESAAVLNAEGKIYADCSCRDHLRNFGAE